MAQAIGVTIVGRSDGHGRPLDLVQGDGSAEALVWPGMGAQHRSMHRFELGAHLSEIGEALSRVLPQRALDDAGQLGGNRGVQLGE